MPLKDILSWAKMLHSQEIGPLNDTQREHVQGILTSTLRELDNLHERSALIANMRTGQEFVNIAFEARTPLNGLIGYSKILLECPELYHGALLNETQREYLEAIFNTGRGVLALLNDIFDYARLRTGITYCQKDRFDVASRSEEHTSELQSQFHLVCRLLL